MSLHDLFALLIGSLTLSTAVMVVFSRNAIYAALYLLLTLMGVACEYALLQAHFLAIIQILVYAGAVVVLIVFVLMMLGFGREQIKGLQLSGPAIILALMLASLLVASGGSSLIRGQPLRIQPSSSSSSLASTADGRIERTKLAHQAKATDSKSPKSGSKYTHQTNATNRQLSDYGSIDAVGKLLVSGYLVAFEVISVLLLMAILGVVVLLREQHPHPSDPNLRGEG